MKKTSVCIECKVTCDGDRCRQSCTYYEHWNGDECSLTGSWKRLKDDKTGAVTRSAYCLAAEALYKAAKKAPAKLKRKAGK